MSLIDIVKSGKNANMRRIEYAVESGLLTQKEADRFQRTGGRRLDFELSSEDIEVVLDCSASGVVAKHISDSLLNNYPSIKEGTMYNRVKEVLKLSEDIKCPGRMSLSEAIKKTIKDNTY